VRRRRAGRWAGWRSVTGRAAGVGREDKGEKEKEKKRKETAMWDPRVRRRVGAQ
jgi:hypothetical protein